MSTLKGNVTQDSQGGSGHLFGVTAGRPPLFQEVREWGTPWLTIRRIGRTAEGGG